jgi:coenzyme F420-reducing hydrogenase beta subunit
MKRRIYAGLALCGGVVATIIIALVAATLVGCATPVDRDDPCYSPEHGRVLPPVYGSDC